MLVPTPYSGDLGKSSDFLLQCSLAIKQQLQTFHTDKSKVIFIMGLLRDQTLVWATLVWKNQPDVYSSFQGFDHPVQGKDAAKHPLTLHQGSHSVVEYVVAFQMLGRIRDRTTRHSKGFSITGSEIRLRTNWWLGTNPPDWIP